MLSNFRPSKRLQNSDFSFTFRAFCSIFSAIPRFGILRSSLRTAGLQSASSPLRVPACDPKAVPALLGERGLPAACPPWRAGRDLLFPLEFGRVFGGAGHDAKMIAKVCPNGMIFVPNVHGISHSPRKLTRWEDAQTAPTYCCKHYCRPNAP